MRKKITVEHYSVFSPLKEVSRVSIFKKVWALQEFETDNTSSDDNEYYIFITVSLLFFEPSSFCSINYPHW